MDGGTKKRAFRSPPSGKRAKSLSPCSLGGCNTAQGKIITAASERRCQSLTPSVQVSRRSLRSQNAPECASSPGPAIIKINDNKNDKDDNRNDNEKQNGQDKPLPQCIVTKLMRTWAIKKREFIKLRRSLITQQNTVLENYAALKELESRAGVTCEESLGEVRVVSVTSWPAHDLLLLVRDDLQVPLTSEISGLFGPQILQQLHAHLNRIPEEMLGLASEVMARRIEVLNFLRDKRRCDRPTNQATLEWKTKNAEFEHETERLHKLVAGTTENLKAKINHSLVLAKVPWLDREEMIKRIEHIQRENLLLQNKIEEIMKKDDDDTKSQLTEYTPTYQAVCEDLAKERAARESLKGVVSSAENMLRVARTRIVSLERQLKEARIELEATRAKHKELEQLVNRLALGYKTHHHRASYDVCSKKLLEISKTGEVTIEGLSRQRDALEFRVNELHEQAATAERAAEMRESEQRSRVESLQAKIEEQEKAKIIAQDRIAELEACVKEVEGRLRALHERSNTLIDMERIRCLKYLPSKESEPSDRETEIWKELQDTKAALSRAEEDLQQSRIDKDSFLNSLSRIVQGGDNSLQAQMGKELLERERKIVSLQHVIYELIENKRNMVQCITQYENQVAALRFEIKRLRHYDCYSKEIPHSELETQLIELHMQVETLNRERTTLFTAAASRALMLERYEKSADLFSRIVRTRREIAALLEGRPKPPLNDDVVQTEVSRSMSSTCASAADTWTALQIERARVYRLERAVAAQSIQLEREGCVRTQLERRRMILEREVLQERKTLSLGQFNQYPSLIQDIIWRRSP